MLYLLPDALKCLGGYLRNLSILYTIRNKTASSNFIGDDDPALSDSTSRLPVSWLQWLERIPNVLFD